MDIFDLKDLNREEKLRSIYLGDYAKNIEREEVDYEKGFDVNGK